jgi:hypothetical protein
MAVNYAVVIKTRAGALRRILTGDANGFRWLSYAKRANDVGLLMFDLDSGNVAIDDLTQDGQVEVWRTDPANNLDWYVDFETFFRAEERRANDDGLSTFRALCPGQMHLLARAVVAWPANTDNRSLFTAVKASTIMTNLVRYNVTGDATVANGRLRTTDLTGITYETDDDDGNVITLACAHQPLLEALQDASRIGDRDFWLERTGAQAWTFRTDNYLGDDRSAFVVFALNYGNMSNPVLQRRSIDERTVVIVGGQGTDDDRAFEVRTGANYDATTNSVEAFYPATQYTTSAGLEAAGDIRLDELEARDELTWDVIQTPGSLYGVHYFLGDLVTGYYEGVSATKQVTGVSVTFAPGGEMAETVQIETGNS